jgi:uncharacterized protein (DUF4415 family)
MKDKSTMRISSDRLADMIDETDWARVAAMTEAEIEAAATADADALLTTPTDWTDARVVRPEGTQMVTLPIDRDVLAWFRRQGRGYQARIGAVLRAFVEAHKEGR